MTPKRIQLSRAKGWKIPQNTINVARGPGRKWGNPFPVQKNHLWKDAAWAVLQFSFWIDQTDTFDGYPDPPSIDEIKAALRGKNLACWCKPGNPCHADVLLDLANK
jgi:Domain of unknown function (DUF4326)